MSQQNKKLKSIFASFTQNKDLSEQFAIAFIILGLFIICGLAGCGKAASSSDGAAENVKTYSREEVRTDNDALKASEETLKNKSALVFKYTASDTDECQDGCYTWEVDEEQKMNIEQVSKASISKEQQRKNVEDYRALAKLFLRKYSTSFQIAEPDGSFIQTRLSENTLRHISLKLLLIEKTYPTKKDGKPFSSEEKQELAGS